MGAYTCEFGIVHKVCRCRTPHTIVCDKVEEYRPNTRLCLVMEMRLDGRITAPKHLKYHLPHQWWYTTEDGGHQIDEKWIAETDNFNRVTRYYCPGQEEVNG